MTKILLSINFLFVSLLIYAQAPGNVSTNLQLWLKADVGTNTTSNGADVTSWADQSTNGYSADAHASSSDDPVYNTNAVNFNPGITFDGTSTNDSDGLILGSDYIFSTNDGMSVYAVVKPSGTGNRRFVMDFGSFAGAGYGIAYSSDEHTNYALRFNGGEFLEIMHSRGTASTLIHQRIDFTSDMFSFLDGAQVTTSAITMTQLTATEINENPTYASNAGSVTIGRLSKNGFGGRVFLGDISEVIIYDNDIDPASTDGQKINSYLALKYGITIDQTSATDYLASDGTTKMWDGTVAAAHNNDIAGIGRDDNSGLNQKQSVSQSLDAIVSVGLGNIAATNSANANTFGTDNTFLTWGNDDGSTTQAGATTSNLPANIDRRMTRVWRTEENNGDVGACQIQIDITGLGYSGSSPSNFGLLIDDDGSNFSNATVTAASSFSSNIVTFNNVNLSDGDFFTLGESDGGLPLPIELISIKAFTFDNVIKLSWETATETNNEGFEIEWSTNNRNWQNIGFVKGAGESFDIQSYQFTHQRPVPDINYYRLKQMDYDGTFEYSDIVSAEIATDDYTKIRLFPNPAQNGEITVSIPNTALETANLELINASGIRVLSQSIIDSNTTLDIQSLPAGLYWLNVNIDGKIIQKKVMID